MQTAYFIIGCVTGVLGCFLMMSAAVRFAALEQPTRTSPRSYVWANLLTAGNYAMGRGFLNHWRTRHDLRRVFCAGVGLQLLMLVSFSLAA